jgi:lipid-A-disaccharide synthase
MKLLVNVKFANIINIINNKEVLPELLQNECNAKEIYNSVQYFLKNPELIQFQLNTVRKTLDNIKSKTSSSEKSAIILSQYL